MQREIDYASVGAEWAEKLGVFFDDLVNFKENLYFHPHPFNQYSADRIATYMGKDMYFLQIKENIITGYGMLRGWDEGFLVPSLGIAIHPKYRNKGFGKQLMIFLHSKAKANGASKIRLKVHKENLAALHLYEKMGYSFNEEENSQQVGYLEL